MFSYFSPESRVPADHPLRSIKARQASYAVSQRKRKRVEEIFGWMKAFGGLRRTRFRGIARVQLHAHFVGAAYNLLRLSRLRPLTG
jgi:IS5 family transposase